MIAVYFNNYKGFTNTFLQLSDVDFFVGEKNTGKTSVLNLITLITDNNFWIEPKFYTKDFEIAFFNEIAGVNEFFEIGLIVNIEIFKDVKILKAIKLKFYNDNGIPAIKEISLILNNKINLKLLLVKSNILYHISKIETKNILKSNDIEFFKDWIKKSNFNKNEENFTINAEKELLSIKEFPFLLLGIIERINKEKKTRRLEFDDSSYFYFLLENIKRLEYISKESKGAYDSFEKKHDHNGIHISYFIKELKGKGDNKEKKEKIISLLKKFGENSELYKKIKIKEHNNGNTSSFEIQITLDNTPLTITKDGYNVSQILPIISEIITNKNYTWFAIQQPEIHLQPKGQTAFGDLILNSAIIENKRFLIETHSEVIIDRFRTKLAKSKMKIISQIVFFNRKEGKNELTYIDILEGIGNRG